MHFDTKIELVKLTDDSKRKIENKDLFAFDPKITPQMHQRFSNFENMYYHLSRLMRNEGHISSVMNINSNLKIISPCLKNRLYLNSFYDNIGNIEISTNKNPLNLTVTENFDQIIRLFYQSIMQKYNNASDYSVNYNTFIDLNNDLLHDVNTNNDESNELINHIHLYGGFNYVLRTYYNNLYLQLSPKSSISIDSDINFILESEYYEKSEFVSHFENVYLPIGRRAKLHEILDKTVNEPIDEEPFSGRNFLEFANIMYPTLNFTDKNAKLLLVIPSGNSSVPWYFSSELVVPSMTFSDLAAFNSSFYRTILSKSKNYSANRESHIQNIIERNLFSYLEERIVLEPSLVSIYKDVPSITPNSYEVKYDPIYILNHPEVVFFNTFKNAIEDIRRDPPNYTASPGDILKHEELTCFHAPKQIEVTAFSDSRYERDALILLNKLREIFPLHFNCDFICDSIISIDDLSVVSPEYSKLDRSEIDCVLVFGPRYIQGDNEKTRLIYTVPETSILNQGIPVQYIADDSSQYKQYGQSIRRKAYNTHALFGIGLNILSKIGSVIMGLYEETYSQFIPNSIVMGYNVIRIFDQKGYEVIQGQSIRQLVRNATKIAAPIVMMSEDGTDLIMQDVFELPSETGLFEDEPGAQIIDKIPNRYKTLIIHKDGRFFDKELSDLRDLSNDDLSIIPVSIISYLSPRMFSSKRMNRTPDEGTIFRLSQKDFLMSTPLLTSNPLVSGWPNTILVTVHDLIKPMSDIDRIKILYQIFALTRIHQASQLPTRKPISIHYSNSMGEFLRKCRDPRPKYFKYFMNKPNRHNYLPKIFL